MTAVFSKHLSSFYFVFLSIYWTQLPVPIVEQTRKIGPSYFYKFVRNLHMVQFDILYYSTHTNHKDMWFDVF